LILTLDAYSPLPISRPNVSHPSSAQEIIFLKCWVTSPACMPEAKCSNV
jgi:hypothetical protein